MIVADLFLDFNNMIKSFGYQFDPDGYPNNPCYQDDPIFKECPNCKGDIEEMGECSLCGGTGQVEDDEPFSYLEDEDDD